VRRSTVLVRSHDARWRELFERADVISEGAPRDEADERHGTFGRTWFGSTSVILDLPSATREELRELAALAACDLHVRTRVVRLAQREAAVRAPQPLGRAVCELRFVPDPRGLRIDVDLQAPLIGVHAAATPKAPSP
jgi:hypothetical protein